MLIATEPCSARHRREVGNDASGRYRDRVAMTRSTRRGSRISCKPRRSLADLAMSVDAAMACDGGARSAR
jgi:hypothetical protein